MPLEREIETYHRMLPELLAHEGEFVVIHGDELLGCFSDLDEALRHGFERYGDNAFLARQVSRTEKVLFSSRSLRPCPTSRQN